jgi:hypothetical protein
VSSRLAVDQRGWTVVEIVTPSLGLDTGERFLIVDRFRLGWLSRPGRTPTAKERMSARPPYEPLSARKARQEAREVPDDELDEKAALEACIREQEREPTDLIGRVA